MAQIESMVRAGFVSDADKTKGVARVCFPENGMVSDWLKVMRYPHMSISGVEGASIGDWFPAVNDKVLVLMAYGFNSDGYILGVIQ